MHTPAGVLAGKNIFSCKHKHVFLALVCPCGSVIDSHTHRCAPAVCRGGAMSFLRLSTLGHQCHACLASGTWAHPQAVGLLAEGGRVPFDRPKQAALVPLFRSISILLHRLTKEAQFKVDYRLLIRCSCTRQLVYVPGRCSCCGKP